MRKIFFKRQSFWTATVSAVLAYVAFQNCAAHLDSSSINGSSGYQYIWTEGSYTENTVCLSASPSPSPTPFYQVNDVNIYSTQILLALSQNQIYEGAIEFNQLNCSGDQYFLNLDINTQHKSLSSSLNLIAIGTYSIITTDAPAPYMVIAVQLTISSSPPGYALIKIGNPTQFLSLGNTAPTDSSWLGIQNFISERENSALQTSFSNMINNTEDANIQYLWNYPQ